MSNEWIRKFRLLLPWVFGNFALMNFWLAVRWLRLAAIRHHVVHGLLFAAPLLLFSIIFACAWWALWKKGRYATVWGIVASATEILIFILSINNFPHSVWQQHWAELFVGLFGLFIFLQRPSQGG